VPPFGDRSLLALVPSYQPICARSWPTLRQLIVRRIFIFETLTDRFAVLACPQSQTVQAIRD